MLSWHAKVTELTVPACYQQCVCHDNTDVVERVQSYNVLYAGCYDREPMFSTPQKHLEDVRQVFAQPFSLSGAGTSEHSPQISPASVLSVHDEPVSKASTPSYCYHLDSPLWTLLN